MNHSSIEYWFFLLTTIDLLIFILIFYTIYRIANENHTRLWRTNDLRLIRGKGKSAYGIQWEVTQEIIKTVFGCVWYLFINIPPLPEKKTEN